MIFAAGKPLKCGSRSGPADHCVVTTDDSGTIWPCLLRVYRRVRSSGFCRNVASDCTITHQTSAEQVVLAHRQRAELRLDRAVDVLDRNAEQRRLVAVDVGAQLLRVARDRWWRGRSAPAAARAFCEELLHHFVERDRVAACRCPGSRTRSRRWCRCPESPAARSGCTIAPSIVLRFREEARAGSRARSRFFAVSIDPCSAP